MSETWIRPDTTIANLSEITPPGYNLYQQPREVRRGGGLGFFVKDDWILPLFQQRPAPPLKISSSRYPFTKNLFTL